MSNIKQFEKAVTEAGAVAMRVIRGSMDQSVWSFRHQAA